MKKRTQRKPLIFDREGSTFRTHALGFLEANEVLLKYLPTIISLTEELENARKEMSENLPDGEEAEINITSMLENLPDKIITNVCRDLLYKTEFQEENGTFVTIDPANFDDISECLAVIWEVFQYNYPDFFEKGQGSALPEQKDQTTTPVPQSLMEKVMGTVPDQKRTSI